MNLTGADFQWQDLLSLVSWQKIFSILALMLAVWLLLVALHWLLTWLAEQLPRHRLLMLRVFPPTRVLAWSAAVLYALLGIIQPHASVLFAMLGSAGLALGLATQDPMKNMVAGLIIMVNPPYRVGDMVTLAGHYGEVIKLEWSVTWLKTFADDTIMVPNAEALKSAVANANSGALYEQVAICFYLPVSADQDLAMALAQEATLCSPYCYLKKPVQVLLDNELQWGQNWLKLSVRAYVLDVRLERRFYSEVQQRVLAAFKVSGLLGAKELPTKVS